MTGIKIYKEDNRTIVVFENPTEEQDQAIQNAFMLNPIMNLSGLFTTEKEPDENPIPDREPDQTSTENKVAESKGYDSKLIAACKKLLKDPKKQQEIGIDETIKIEAAALGENLETCENWLKTASQEKKEKQYALLKKKVLSA